MMVTPPQVPLLQKKAQQLRPPPHVALVLCGYYGGTLGLSVVSL